MNIRRTCLALLLPIVASTSLAQSTEHNVAPGRSAPAHATGRLLVKWHADAADVTRAAKATSITGMKLRRNPSLQGQLDVLESDGAQSVRALEQAAAKLSADGTVEYASVEYRRTAHATTSDPLLLQQWYLLSNEVAATRSNNAWDLTQGNAAVVVAVLDTGVRFDHPDLGTVGTNGGKLLPGYDFVSNSTVANDSNGRDSDASDPGDWVNTTDKNNTLFAECDETASSWHGTRVSGLIAARTNNGTGVAGNAWSTQILPVRVLGKCGGVDGDIIDAMRWAAGLSVAGIPLNPTPAKVINLSLGGEGACTAAYQAAVNEVMAAGSLVVASAGNEGTQVSAPANCTGVLGVAGLRHIGTKVGFSNLGPEVGIGAPGGNCVNTTGGPCLYSIVVATNNGSQGPGAHGYTDQLNYNIGTSFSSPMVASAAALLKAVNSSLSPRQVTLLLKDSATPYPTNPDVEACSVPSTISSPQDEECNCTTETCGAGMLNTGAAVAAATKPLAVLETSGTVSVGSTLTLNATNSFAAQGHSIASYNWTITNLSGSSPTIANASGANTTLQFPGEAQFTLRLTVTDEQGTQDSSEISLATGGSTPPPVPAPVPGPSPPPAPTPEPSPPPTTGITRSGGGGGGAIGLEILPLGLLALAYLTQRRRLVRIASC